jgi:hypothetical protein
LYFAVALFPLLAFPMIPLVSLALCLRSFFVLRLQLASLEGFFGPKGPRRSGKLMSAGRLLNG